MAAAYGARGVQAASLAEMVKALEEALTAETATFIDVETPRGFANFS